MRETGVRCPVEALNFSVHWNPLLHLAPNYGIHGLVPSKREDTLSPEGGVNVMVDSYLGGLVVMTLTQNSRDRGSMTC